MSEHFNYIAGEWVPSRNLAANVNPSDTEDIIGHYPRADAEQAHAAISAAAEAAGAWAALPALARFEFLDRIGGGILARIDELGDMLAREEGKTLSEARAEAHRAGHLFKFFATEAYRETGELFPSIREGVGLEVRREPLGVVGIITPWNFPLAIPAWKIAPALAYGNTVVLKPAELVPGSAELLTRIIAEAGLPKGVFNCVMGDGQTTGTAIVDHPDVAGVSFTGSTRVGQAIGMRLFSRGARMQLEMGGKNPLVVLADADLDRAVDCAIQGSFHSTGQRCTASSRLIVEDAIHDRFVEQLSGAMLALRVGDARVATTQVGPVASEAQLDIDLDYIALGEREGASLIGGARLNRDRPGYYLQPALFTEASSEMAIAREEIFGPVAVVLRASDFEHAVALANDTPFGLSAGLVTRNPARIEDFKRRAQAGMIQVNLPTAGMDFHAPFTGRKLSAYGPPEKGSHAREFFTAAKVVHEGRAS